LMAQLPDKITYSSYICEQYGLQIVVLHFLGK